MHIHNRCKLTFLFQKPTNFLPKPNEIKHLNAGRQNNLEDIGRKSNFVITILKIMTNKINAIHMASCSVE